MENLGKYYKITAKQEYEKNPKLSESDVQELLKWSDENINLHGKMIGECDDTHNEIKRKKRTI